MKINTAKRDAINMAFNEIEAINRQVSKVKADRIERVIEEIAPIEIVEEPQVELKENPDEEEAQSPKKSRKKKNKEEV